MKHWLMTLIFVQALLLVAPCFATNYCAEVFNFNTFDLEGKTVTYTPDASYPGGYTISMTNDLLWVDDSDASLLSYMIAGYGDPYDDETFNYGLVGSVPFYGVGYTELFVNANGSITFAGSDDTLYGSITDHFSQPRVSVLFHDLEPFIRAFYNNHYGELTFKQDGEKVVLTYRNFPSRVYHSSYLNTFQCVLYKNGAITQPPGTIVMSWQNINLYPNISSSYQAVVGLSPGGGIPAGFVESDISERAFDNDIDGILDSWELYWFGDISWCNPTENWDEDNVDHLGEFISGTDPFDGDSVFKAEYSHNGSQIIIGWNVLEGRTYSIKWKNSLSDSVYNTLISNLTYPTSNYVINAMDAQRYYKVTVDLQ